MTVTQENKIKERLDREKLMNKAIVAEASEAAFRIRLKSEIKAKHY